MDAGQAALEHPVAAAPVVDDGLGQAGQHRRDERVGDHRRHAVPGVQRGLGHPDAQVPRADQQRVVGLQDVGLVGQVGQPGPAGAERLDDRGALPAGPVGRARPPGRLARSGASTAGSRSNAASGSYTRRYDAKSDGTARSSHENVRSRDQRSLRLVLPAVGDRLGSCTAPPRRLTRDRATTDTGAIHGCLHRTSHGHEQVVFCQDRPSGLRAIIAIYSTALGPALGGTRFYPYASRGRRPARRAGPVPRRWPTRTRSPGLDLGGGKAVIWGDPDQDKTEALLRAYGRFVAVARRPLLHRLRRRHVRRRTWTSWRRRPGSSPGAPSRTAARATRRCLPPTGVFQGMRAAAEHRWGTPDAAGRRVGIAGLGKVGKRLTEHLIDDGAAVVATDVIRARARAGSAPTYPQVDLVADTDALVAADLDVYAPCALGGALNDETVRGAARQDRRRCGEQPAGPPGRGEAARRARRALRARLRRQLGRGHPGGRRDRGFQLRPGASSGPAGSSTPRGQILQLAEAEGVPPAVAADRLAERRMAEVGRLRTILLVSADDHGHDGGAYPTGPVG